MKDQFQKSIEVYREQLNQGYIQQAYKGILTSINEFRMYLQKAYPEYQIPNTMHDGVMDITYFAFSPNDLRSHKLKIALVFNHQDFNFELWLVGQNKKVQKAYWTMFKESDWAVYPLTPSPEHAIVRTSIYSNPHFEDRLQLYAVLEEGLVDFITHIQWSIQIN